MFETIRRQPGQKQACRTPREDADHGHAGELGSVPAHEQDDTHDEHDDHDGSEADKH
jgi:hypothetical protein